MVSYATGIYPAVIDNVPMKAKVALQSSPCQHFLLAMHTEAIEDTAKREETTAGWV